MESCFDESGSESASRSTLDGFWGGLEAFLGAPRGLVGRSWRAFGAPRTRRERKKRKYGFRYTSAAKTLVLKQWFRAKWLRSRVVSRKVAPKEAFFNKSSSEGGLVESCFVDRGSESASWSTLDSF